MLTSTFYQFNEKYTGDRSISKAIEAGRLTEDDSNLIKEYTYVKGSRDGNSDTRIKKIIFTLVSWRRFILKPYRDATIIDIYEGIKLLKEGTSQRGKPFTQNAKHDYIRILRQFYVWLIREQYSTIPEQKIKDIRVPAVDSETTEPDAIITPEEIDLLLKACKHSRDRALISCFYESGARVGELARLTWKDLTFDEWGVKCRIKDTKQKKGQISFRYSRLTLSQHHLATWKNDCPDKSPEAPVFINLQDGSPITYITVTRLIARLQKISGIEKRLNPHIFRKSRITHMIAQNYQESVVKKSMWNNLDTKMFKTYVCLGEDEIDDEFLNKAGIRRKKKPEENVLAPITCERCHYLNAAGMSFCGKCGRPLTPEAIDSVQDATKAIEQSLAYGGDDGLVEAITRRVMEEMKKGV